MDLTPYVSSLTILDKKVRLRRLRPNWAQQEYLDSVRDQFASTGRARVITLKARQLGLSTITEACGFSLSFIIPNYRSLVIAHEADASRNLLRMTKRYWANAPWKDHYTLKHNTRNDIEWEETGSSFGVATAGKKGDAGVGRSATNHFVHASEVGLWEDAESVMLGLQNSVPPTPGTFIVLESTANGTGNYFHRTWEEAEAGDSDYVPLFFPWWRHPEYTIEFYRLLDTPLGHLDEDETLLVSLLSGVSRDEQRSRILWRRWAIRNLCGNNTLKFQQEYPATPEEAFVASGLNVFPHEALRDCYHRAPGVPGYLFRNGDSVTFTPDPAGPLRMFKQPTASASYVIGGDPTRTVHGDYACAQIINRHTLEQVGVWRGRTTPGQFAEELYKLGLFFNVALLCPETNGPGQTTIAALMSLSYPNLTKRQYVDRHIQPGTPTYGWHTTPQSKDLAVGWALQHIVNRELTIHDHNTFMEFRDYVTADRGGYGPSDEKHGHDDAVMSMSIALTAHHLAPPPVVDTAPISSLVDRLNNPQPATAGDPYALP